MAGECLTEGVDNANSVASSLSFLSKPSPQKAEAFVIIFQTAFCKKVLPCALHLPRQAQLFAWVHPHVFIFLFSIAYVEEAV